jgi:hypothetical protein
LFSRIFLAVAFSLLSLPYPAFALDPSAPPSDDLINNTFQCEAGRVGQALQKKGLAVNQKVAATWTISQTEESGWGFGVKVPIFDLGFDAGTAQQNLDEATSTGVPFNMHPDNLSVCRGYKIEIIKGGVGLADCFLNKKPTSLKNVLIGESGTTGCHSKVTLGRKIGGSGKFPVWGVGIGPGGNYGVLTSWTLRWSLHYARNSPLSSLSDPISYIHSDPLNILLSYGSAMHHNISRFL